MVLYRTDVTFNKDIGSSAFLWFSGRRQEQFLIIYHNFGIQAFYWNGDKFCSRTLLCRSIIHLFSLWTVIFTLVSPRADNDVASLSRSISSDWPDTSSLSGFQGGSNFLDSTLKGTAAAITRAQGFREFKPPLQGFERKCLSVLPATTHFAWAILKRQLLQFQEWTIKRKNQKLSFEKQIEERRL